jgi:cell division protease FtsH
MSRDALFDRRRLLAAAALLLTLVGAGLFWHGYSPTDSAGLAPEIVAMRSDAGPWQQREHDAAFLFRELDAGRVSAVGLGNEAVLVSTSAGDRYYVANAGEALSRALFQRLDQGQQFALATLPPGLRGSTIALIALSLLVMGFVTALVLLKRPITAGAGRFGVARRETGIRFQDVIGADEAKSALQEVVDYLKDPQRFTRVGARPPRGVLLSGPPGTGKTLLARALAGESGIHFIAATGSDFSSMYLGLGILKVQQLFRRARKHSPCIVFIDEIDGIGRRTSGERGDAAENESNRIINQLLTELDGFANDSGIIVIGATNYPERVDPALTREGRFDRKIQLALPTVADRLALFRLYTDRIEAAPDLDCNQLARLTTGLAPAAIAAIVNQAALVAARRQSSAVTMADFVEAIEICRIGEKPVSAVALTEAERERIAIHEAGHALAGYLLEVGTVEKVTIVPRGQSLGVTLITPIDDQRLYVRSFLENRIKMLLAGRTAELLRYRECSSGAAQDLKEASRIAFSMVATMGLGDEGNLFSLEALGEMNLRPELEAPVASAEKLLQRLGFETEALLQTHRSALEAITRTLLERESIDGDELAALATATHDDAEAVAEAPPTRH